MRISILFLILLWPFAGMADPGTGIVRDSRGNIIYTDLSQIWMITPDGRRSIVVPRVHSHELCLDAADNLYGEHLWYEGEATDKWGHYIWKRSPDGRISMVRDSTEGLLTGYSFVRDKTGNLYWIEPGKPCSFIQKSADGVIRTIATGSYDKIGRQFFSRKGDWCFFNGDDLYALRNGQIRKLASGLGDGPGIPFMLGMDNYMVGIWDDAAGNLYVAAFGRQAVKKITPEGKVSTLLTTEGDWAPCSGVFDPDGSLYLMEYSRNNETRVRKILPAKLAKGMLGKPEGERGGNLPALLMIMAVLTLGIMAIQLRKAKRI